MWQLPAAPLVNPGLAQSGRRWGTYGPVQPCGLVQLPEPCPDPELCNTPPEPSSEAPELSSVASSLRRSKAVLAQVKKKQEEGAFPALG